MASDAAGPGRLVVGLVRGIHGLRGAVRVEVLSDDPARFEPGSVLYAEGSSRPLTVTWSGPGQPGVLVRFRELATRSAAEPLRDAYLEADAPAAGLPEGAVYWHELEGATVTTGDGEWLGTVAEVFRAGENEVLVVQGGPRGELLVPAVQAVMSEWAPREGRIVVDREALALDDEAVPPRPRGRRTTRRLRATTSGEGEGADAAATQGSGDTVTGAGSEDEDAAAGSEGAAGAA
jgi:16S rRNA processing protein RimM